MVVGGGVNGVVVVLKESVVVRWRCERGATYCKSQRGFNFDSELNLDFLQRKLE